MLTRPPRRPWTPRRRSLRARERRRRGGAPQKRARRGPPARGRPARPATPTLAREACRRFSRGQ
eukprot:2527186-Lingulodinium_polyedra.AAC.1